MTDEGYETFDPARPSRPASAEPSASFDPEADYTSEPGETEAAPPPLDSDRWEEGARPFEPGPPEPAERVRAAPVRAVRPKRRGAHERQEPAADPALPPPPPAPAPLPPPPPDRRSQLGRGQKQPRGPRRRGPLAATIKVAFAVVLATGAAGAVGTALGLPLPGESGEVGVDAGTAPGIEPGVGTSAVLSDGPYHPIKVRLVNYGEFAAKFGGGRSHEGQDMFAGVGTPLVAVRAGKVVDTSIDHGKYAGGRGNYIYIYSPQDDRSYGYFHMRSPPALRIGDKVAAGQEVGRLGCTGSCDGPHLHFEVRIGKASFGGDTKPINPLPLLKRWPAVPGSTRGDGLPQSPPYKEPGQAPVQSAAAKQPKERRP